MLYINPIQKYKMKQIISPEISTIKTLEKFLEPLNWRIQKALKTAMARLKFLEGLNNKIKHRNHIYCNPERTVKKFLKKKR
jgi:hypothetical protein